MDLISFLNVGYLADQDELGAEDSPDIAARLSARLYDQVVGNADLAGRTVVEVGCGPGAGSAHLTRTHNPASFLGVDFNQDMIAWCEKKHHDLSNLQFVQGDAQDLPIASNSVDAVINVESSHCYPSRPQFFSEVMRILRPGGLFLYTDLIVSVGENKDLVNAWLIESGLIIEDCIDITENVLAARDAVSHSRSFRTRIQERVPWQVLPETEEYLYLAGTQSYQKLVSRQRQYIQWRASKPGASPNG